MEQNRRNNYERLTGIWNGERVSLTRDWHGISMTQEQLDALCRGEEVCFPNLQSKAGKTYHAVYKLAKGVHEETGKEYVYREFVRYMTRKECREAGVPMGIPPVFFGHVFTDEEIATLKEGKDLHIKDAHSKKTDRNFECDVYYDQEKQDIIFVRNRER